ncbi:hypothetical protein [Bacillus wiedmannii]|uniref:hypothetical protein n=1 Tax=Bacillus wiedmannii TaxID=1890302 RepID=UPI000BF144CC|nr:hypothetical protein [Bacillus wiedmannii]PEM30169.1 hypothetical protein CN598_12645 [Bacillus wiedmannii]
MTALMIYLLVGAMWALLCKLSGEIDKLLERDSLMSNTIKWQLVFFVIITIFWAPVMVSMALGKCKGE